jgi:hypothetical protein
MASFVVTINGISAGEKLMEGASVPRGFLNNLQNMISGIENGSLPVSTVVAAISSTDAVRAVSEVTATTSGSLGTVINGTTVTTTFSTSQAGTAAQAIADINANTTVNKWVTASPGSTATKFYVTANIPGELGNGMTLTVTGTGASATGSGKLATGAGNNGQPTTFVF